MEFHRPDEHTKNVIVNKVHNKKLYLVIIVLLLIPTSIVAANLFFKNHTKEQDIVQISSQVSTQQVAKVPDYSSVEGRYLFNGTIVLARAVERYARGDYAQPFSQLSSLNPEKYDAWAADFECPITNNVVPYETQISNLVFNCRPEWLPELTKYVQLFNLANNHTADQGAQTGFNETRGHLKAAGVQYFGNYDPSITDDICEVVALPVRKQKVDKTEEKALLPVAFCAWHFFNFNRGPAEAELIVVKKYAARMPVFAFVEMGNEYQASASAGQRAIAKSIIDQGADFVMANNPHWVQDSEVYKDKLIVYSLGNFIFDQIDAETQRGVSMDTTISVQYDAGLDAWLELGKKCTIFKDTCLEDASKAGLKKVQVKFTYVPIAVQNGAQKITRKATDAVQKAVEERLNWEQVSKQLGQ